jgi:hypothetical protein
LIFGHQGNPRAAASVILVGVLAALIGSVFMAIGPRFLQEPRPTRDAYIGGGSTPVRVVGPARRENGSCEQQVWPNIDQRCLVRTDAAVYSNSTSSPKQNSDFTAATSTGITLDNQPPSPAATPNYVTTSALPEQSAPNATELSDATAELSEQPRKRPRRHYRPFHLIFGSFRF